MNPSPQMTILLVDDEPPLIRLGSILLQRLGYRCLTAASAAEALEAAKAHAGELDLLMTDVMLPEMNGRELAEKVLADNPGIRRLYISGYTAGVISSEEATKPDVAFLAKPFTKDQLAAKLAQLFGG